MQIRLAIQPSFGEVITWPSRDLTALQLQSSADSNVFVVMRLLNFGLTRGLNPQRVDCDVSADNVTSSLAITFSYFGEGIDYDPGTCSTSSSMV